MKIQTFRDYTNPDVIASSVVLNIDQFRKTFYSVGSTWRQKYHVFVLCTLLDLCQDKTHINNNQKVDTDKCLYIWATCNTAWCNNWKCWWYRLHNLGYLVVILLTLCYVFQPSRVQVFGDWDLCLVYTYIHDITSNLRCSFCHIFLNGKLGCVLNSRCYFLLIRSLENITSVAGQVVLLKEQYILWTVKCVC